MRFETLGKSVKRMVLTGVLAATAIGWALTPPPPIQWQSMSSSGSKVELPSPTEAVITLRRTTPGPKTDPETHGYAYILSNPLVLPAGWNSVTFSGRWW